VHRSCSLDAQDTTHHQGIPITTVHRTLLDSPPTLQSITSSERSQAERLQLHDRAKDAALTAAGYKVLRFTWRQLRDEPQTVADRLKAVMRRGQGRPRRARAGPARP
jgi:hypothetical protein